MDSYNYSRSIYELIDAAPSRGTITIRHKRRKYELPMSAAKGIASSAWGLAGETNHPVQTDSDTYPRLYATARSKAGRKALWDLRLVERKKGEGGGAFVERGGGYGWGRRLTEVGAEVARLCFNEITGIDMHVAGREVRRLREASWARSQERQQRVAECLRGLHNAKGTLITSLHIHRDDDELVIAEQIAALREQAAAR